MTSDVCKFANEFGTFTLSLSLSLSLYLSLSLSLLSHHILPKYSHLDFHITVLEAHFKLPLEPKYSCSKHEPHFVGRLHVCLCHLRPCNHRRRRHHHHFCLALLCKSTYIFS